MNKKNHITEISIDAIKTFRAWTSQRKSAVIYLLTRNNTIYTIYNSAVRMYIKCIYIYIIYIIYGYYIGI